MRRFLLPLITFVVVGGYVLFERSSGPGGTGAVADLEGETYARLLAEAEREGRTPDPWLIAHLLLAMPTESERAPWLARLFDRWLEDRNEAPRFPLHTETGRGEQHPDLVLKVLSEISRESTGTPLPAPLIPLARVAMARFEPPTTFEEWNDVAWFLQALAYLAELSTRSSDYPTDFSITGTTTLGEGSTGWTVEKLATETLAVVETLDRVVEDALRAEGLFVRPSATESREIAGVYATTCGGQHLLQAVVTASRAGLLPASMGDRVAGRIEVLIARLEAEEVFREREEARARAAGISATRATRHRVETTLKLHGHALETLSLAAEALPQLRSEIEGAIVKARARTEALLALRLQVLDPQGTIVPRMRNEDPRLWELWFGDGAHALHGLRRARAVVPLGN